MRVVSLHLIDSLVVQRWDGSILSRGKPIEKALPGMDVVIQAWRVVVDCIDEGPKEFIVVLIVHPNPCFHVAIDLVSHIVLHRLHALGH